MHTILTKISSMFGVSFRGIFHIEGINTAETSFLMRGTPRCDLVLCRNFLCPNFCDQTLVNNDCKDIHTENTLSLRRLVLNEQLQILQ